jgi:hypothetical protein
MKRRETHVVDLSSLVSRAVLVPGEARLPWDDPDLSVRMLDPRTPALQGNPRSQPKQALQLAHARLPGSTQLRAQAAPASPQQP